ncbi:MAG: hypothetical protein LCI00_24830 [Chloroflexi bacterium]|nr:hypothetical protein [Chloroflexota bacterium]MCC6895788.1 hypothetical protein [Anaerolineae bacterium]
MSLPGLIMGIVIVVGVLMFIASPFMQRSQAATNDDALIEKQRERLLIVYERVLGNIRDLDEDHATLKISDEDYAAEREIWVQRGIQVLKTLDELDARHTISPSAMPDDIDRAIDTRIEAAVAAYRAKANL